MNDERVIINDDDDHRDHLKSDIEGNCLKFLIRMYDVSEETMIVV